MHLKTKQQTQLVLSRISKSFRARGGKKRVLDQINLDLSAGMVTGLIGLNGAGKTTLLNIIAGTLLPDNGTVDIVNSGNCGGSPVMFVRDSIMGLYARLSFEENVEYFLGRDVLEKTEHPFVKEFISKTGNISLRDLSRGMRQMANICFGLLLEADVYLIDEPTLGLDLPNYQQLIGMIKKLAEEDQKIVLVASHDINFIQQLCEEVHILHGGEIKKKIDLSFRQSNKQGCIELVLILKSDNEIRSNSPDLQVLNNGNAKLLFGPVEQVHQMISQINSSWLIDIVPGSRFVEMQYEECIRDG